MEFSKGIDFYGSKGVKVYDARLALDPDRKELTIGPKEGDQQETVTVSYNDVVKLTYESDRRSRRFLSDETTRWLRIEFQKDTEEEDFLSESRVSQMHSSILARLKAQLQHRSQELQNDPN